MYISNNQFNQKINILTDISLYTQVRHDIYIHVIYTNMHICINICRFIYKCWRDNVSAREQSIRDEYIPATNILDSLSNMCCHYWFT